jgi:5-methylcytosine-specific restriction endonuclease McrA
MVRGYGCTQHATAVDHIIAVADGGAFYDPANLRATCVHCNASRGWRRAREGGLKYRMGVATYRSRF